MPGLLAKRKSDMATVDQVDVENYSDKENSEISHFVRRSTRKSAKPEFLSPSFAPELRKPKSTIQVASDNSSPNYSSSRSEYEIDDSQSRTEESEGDFSEHEISFKKPAAPKPRGRKRKSSSQGKVESKRQRQVGGGEKGARDEKLASAHESEDEEQSLFDIVKGGKTALRAVLDDWIETYNEDREGAMVDLVQFVVQCCGCKGTVTREMIEAEETVQAIRQLTETFDEESHEYPLIATGPASKKFKSNLSHFVELLISQCQYTIIYDEIMMDTFISWLIGLSDSQVRAFRHTSTFAGMKVVSALIDVAKNVSIESDNTQRQLDIENKKPAAKRSREKIEMLQRRREELRQNVADLQEMMTRIFSGIFVHRYRDVRPEIRAICIHELGLWMKNYSSYFGISEQTYTKYIGWTLHDKVGDVRLTALQALQGLYENEPFVPLLELFTDRFKDRIVCMTLDKESDVCVEAIKLVGLFFKHDLLLEEDASQVDQLVFCDQKSVSHAAGEFLNMRLFYQGSADESEELIKSPSRGRKGTKGALIKQTNMKYLVEFFLESEIHDHAAYLVDSLWDHCDLLKDWTTYACILLDTNCLIEMNDAQETALIEIMTASCKQAASGHGPTGRGVKRTMSVKEKKLLMDERHNLSTHFMEYLPHLLAKFETDPDKASNLLLIPQCFELEIYAEKRLVKCLEDLLNHIENIVLKHGDEKLLEICSKTLQFLTDNDLITQQTAELARHRLVDQLVDKFQSSLAAGIPPADVEDKSDAEYYNFVINLRRIAALYKAHDLRGWELQKDLHTIIERGAKDSVDDEVLRLSVKCMHTSILWSLADLDPNKPSKADMKTLKKRLNTFMSQLDQLVQYSSDAVKNEAFLVLCDLLVFFAVQLKNTSPVLHSLVYEADSSIQVRLRDYTMSCVFSSIDEDDDAEDDDEGDDSKAQELNEKRIILAAFCKLVAFNVFHMKLAAPIFAQLIRAYSGYSDIIKHTMSKAKEINAVAFAKTLLLSLQQAFEILREEQGGEIDTSSDGFHSLRDLARRFALLLGVNIKSDQSRKCTLTLHRDGILYSLSNTQIDEGSSESVPRNLAFFEVLHEFIYRLAAQDRIGKHGILPFLEEHAGEFVGKSGLKWRPLSTYRKGLLSKEPDTAHTEEQHDAMVEAAPTKATVKTKGGVVGRGRAKKKLSMGRGSGRSEQWLNAKKSHDDTTQEAIHRNSGASRLEAANSSEDEAVNTLQRKKKSGTIDDRHQKTSQAHEEKKTPRPRGRPRKERPFEKLSKNIEESPALIIDSQSESISQEYSRDSDFEITNQEHLKNEETVASDKIVPGKRRRDHTGSDEEETTEDPTSGLEESEDNKSEVTLVRKRQKQEVSATASEASEQEYHSPSSSAL